MGAAGATANTANNWPDGWTATRCEAEAHACARWIRRHRRGAIGASDPVAVWADGRGYGPEILSEIRARVAAADEHQRTWRDCGGRSAR